MTLQEAIIIANECLKSGEGIDLFYYMEDLCWGKPDNREEQEIIEAIKTLSFLKENK